MCCIVGWHLGTAGLSRTRDELPWLMLYLPRVASCLFPLDSGARVVAAAAGLMVAALAGLYAPTKEPMKRLLAAARVWHEACSVAYALSSFPWG